MSRPSAPPRIAPVSAPSADRTDTALLQFQGVWRYFGHGRKRWPVLQDVGLEVSAGQAVCVRGRNGAGKTTLLRIATGMLAPDRGHVTLDGMTSEGHWREYHRAIGFLSAGDRGLFARFSVRSHVDYAARLAFVPSAQRASAVEAMLETFVLHDLSDRRADRLSQGQRQRLRLALALVHRPRVLLLDEPRNSLDDEGIAMLVAGVQHVLVSGGSILWCCPVGEEQPLHFERTVWLEEGRLRPE
jgi:ABC-2 type transport system ATP-binding protein